MSGWGTARDSLNLTFSIPLACRRFQRNHPELPLEMCQSPARPSAATGIPKAVSQGKAPGIPPEHAQESTCLALSWETLGCTLLAALPGGARSILTCSGPPGLSAEHLPG